LAAEEGMDEQTLVWDHFKLNAEQRLKSFNFFLLVAIFVNGGVINAIDKKLSPALLMLLGTFLCVLSLVFWLADTRSKNLLKLSVDALLEMESSYNEKFQLFRIDREARGTFARFTVAIGTLLAVQFMFGAVLAGYAACQLLP
jgi:hypothetical protein